MNPSVCGGGDCDSEHIGPWSLWQGNLKAELMVVGQDWGDENYFVANRGHDDPRNRTNDTLRRLLASIGITIDAPSPADSGGGALFFTNAVLCLKQGGMQSAVRREWFTECGSRFLRPTIDVVGPKVVVTLGERAYRAVAAVYGLKPLPFRRAVEYGDGFALAGGIRLFPVYHCGARMLNTHRRMEMQMADWAKIARALNAATVLRMVAATARDRTCR